MSPSFFNITLCFDIIVCHTQILGERIENSSFPIKVSPKLKKPRKKQKIHNWNYILNHFLIIPNNVLRNGTKVMF